MAKNAPVVRARSSGLRDWIDPIRIYNPNLPAGRLVFLWGLAIYPLVVIFLLLTTVIVAIETFSTSSNTGDYIGIMTYLFMLAWLAAAVAVCLRRLKYLGRSKAWVWLVVLPIVNLLFFLYLLLKSGPIDNSEH